MGRSTRRKGQEEKPEVVIENKAIDDKIDLQTEQTDDIEKKEIDPKEVVESKDSNETFNEIKTLEDIHENVDKNDIDDKRRLNKDNTDVEKKETDNEVEEIEIL